MKVYQCCFKVVPLKNSQFVLPMVLAVKRDPSVVFEMPVQSPKSSANGIDYSKPVLIYQVWANSDTFLQKLIHFKKTVCMFMCLFVLYSRLHPSTNCSKTQRRLGNWQSRCRQNFQHNATTCLLDFCKKSTRFFGQNSHWLPVAEWLSGVERKGPNWGVKQCW